MTELYRVPQNSRKLLVSGDRQLAFEKPGGRDFSLALRLFVPPDATGQAVSP